MCTDIVNEVANCCNFCKTNSGFGFENTESVPHCISPSLYVLNKQNCAFCRLPTWRRVRIQITAISGTYVAFSPIVMCENESIINITGSSGLCFCLPRCRKKVVLSNITRYNWDIPSFELVCLLCFCPLEWYKVF